jgi:hypothetical protein
VKSEKGWASFFRAHWRWLVRLLGLGLLIWLLFRIDINDVLHALQGANLFTVIQAFILLIPLIALKSLRWLLIMGTPFDGRSFLQATLAYFSGLFLGFLTPGRLGEFIRIFYARGRLAGDTIAATVSVLVDRFFDLAALLVLGGLALAFLPYAASVYRFLGWGFILAGAAIPVLMLLFRADSGLQRFLKQRDWSWGKFSLNPWLASLAKLRHAALWSGFALTALAYGLFYSQGYLLAQAMALPLNYFSVAFALSLASLVALLPISISGLGTREWVVTLYLGTQGVSPERALAFSALIFLTFNLGGSLLGGISWLAYPEGLRSPAEEAHEA